MILAVGMNKVLSIASSFLLKTQTYFMLLRKILIKEIYDERMTQIFKHSSSYGNLLSGLRSYSQHIWTIFIIFPDTDHFFLTCDMRVHGLNFSYFTHIYRRIIYNVKDEIKLMHCTQLLLLLSPQRDIIRRI